jgi:hypothetical protein
MALSFSSPKAFAEFLASAAENSQKSAVEAMSEGGAALRDMVKASIGQEGNPGWAPLSDATMEGFYHQAGFRIPGKTELGYGPGQQPLLRDGELRDSYVYEMEKEDGKFTVSVGSDMKLAAWQEMGTPDAVYPIPPRPVLGAVFAQHGEEVVDRVAARIIDALIGGQLV